MKFLVRMATGEGGDYRTRVVLCFDDKERAEAFAEDLNNRLLELEAHYHNDSHNNWDDADDAAQNAMHVLEPVIGRVSIDYTGAEFIVTPVREEFDPVTQVT